MAGSGLRQKLWPGLWIWKKKKGGRSASAARAGRRRNGPMVIAVHRRRANKTPAGPVSTTRLQNPGPAPYIYKYTIKIIITPFDAKFEGVNSFFLQIFFQSQSVYTKMWGLKKTFVYSTYEIEES
jgi:hypothetical protein